MDKFPLELLRSIQSVVEIEVDAFLEAQETTRRYAVRVNANKMKCSDLSSHLPVDRAVPWAGDNAYWLSQPINFRKDALWQAGAYYVQEASSMFLRHVLHSLDLPQGQKCFLDACASPGGKTTILYDAMGDEDWMIANESTQTRQSALIQNITKWGMKNVAVTQLFAEQMLPLWQETFDVVLADVPCSGSGLFRKKKSHQDVWTEQLVCQSAQRQKQIIQKLSLVVREGGYLVYSTCSYSPEENEAIIDLLLGSGMWQSVEVTISPDWGIVPTHSPEYRGKGYRFFPHLSGGEGFYLSVLKKIKSPAPTPFPAPRFASKSRSKPPAPTFALATKHIQANIEATIPSHPATQTSEMYMQGEKIWTGSEQFFAFLERYFSSLRFTHIAGQVGKIKGNIFTPSHALALLPYPETAIQCRVELSQEDSERFISGGDIALNVPIDPQIGKWRLASYAGVGIGWIKVTAEGTSKNYFPLAWVGV